MIAKKNRPPPSGSGSKTLTYILVGVLVILVGYYIVLPAFTPRSPSTTATPTNTGTATISLTPGADIAGTMVTISGQKFQSNANVSVQFGSRTFSFSELNGTCATSSTGALSNCNFWVPKTAAPGTYAVTVTAGGSSAEVSFSVPQYSPPESTVLVTLTAVALGVITQLVTRRVVDLNKERRMRAEVNAFNKEKREATLANDKARLEKLKKRELAVRQEQAKVSTARLKVTAVTFVPLLAVYYLMASFLGGYTVIVACSPCNIPLLTAPTLTPGTFELSFFWWYFLSSFAFSLPLTRLFHTNP